MDILNFTKMTETELLEEVPENANMFVEADGEVKRIPPITQSELLEEVPEDAHTVVEADGKIVRLPYRDLSALEALPVKHVKMTGNICPFADVIKYNEYDPSNTHMFVPTDDIYSYIAVYEASIPNKTFFIQGVSGLYKSPKYTNLYSVRNEQKICALIEYVYEATGYFMVFTPFVAHRMKDGEVKCLERVVFHASELSGKYRTTVCEYADKECVEETILDSICHKTQYLRRNYDTKPSYIVPNIGCQKFAIGNNYYDVSLVDTNYTSALISGLDYLNTYTMPVHKGSIVKVGKTLQATTIPAFVYASTGFIAPVVHIAKDGTILDIIDGTTFVNNKTYTCSDDGYLILMVDNNTMNSSGVVCTIYTPKFVEVDKVVLKPLILEADMAETYNTDPTYGDEALQAILDGRQILVCTPNADGGNHTKIFSPVYMHQLPNYENDYLYLFYLRDEKQTLDLSALGMGTIQLPVYGELKMKLSIKYNECPLV